MLPRQHASLSRVDFVVDWLPMSELLHNGCGSTSDVATGGIDSTNVGVGVRKVVVVFVLRIFVPCSDN